MISAAIRPARREDAPGIAKIWHLSFGDDTSYINRLLLELNLIDTCVVACVKNGKILSAMCAFDRLRLGGANASYIYALCTHPEFRSRGLGRAVAGEAVRLAFARGAAMVCLHAASPGLEHWYTDTLNFRRLSFSCETLLAPERLENAAFERISADNVELREGFPGLSAQLLRAQALSGSFFRCSIPGGRYYLNAELTPGGEAIIRGLSCPSPLCRQLASAAGAALSAKSVRLVLPSETGVCNLMGVFSGASEQSGAFLPFLLE